MKKVLETILISSIFENDKNGDDFIIKSFKQALSIILRKGKHTFQEIPDEIFISIEDLKSNNINDIEAAINSGKKYLNKNEQKIRYIKSQGVLLYDGIHASAFGRMNYIYRSKGLRLYLLENGDILLLTPYCTIDDDGFQLKQEIDIRLNINDIKSIEDIRNLMFLTKKDFNDKNEKIQYVQEIIKILCNIKDVFHKDYFLEYLITPPDVDKISKFSKKIKIKFWDICLSTEFQSNWGVDIQNQAMHILSKLEIQPSSTQLLKYVQLVSSEDNFPKLMEELKRLENNIIDKIEESNQDDIFDFKPNISGIGINGNEAIKRISRMIKKSK